MAQRIEVLAELPAECGVEHRGFLRGEGVRNGMRTEVGVQGQTRTPTSLGFHSSPPTPGGNPDARLHAQPATPPTPHLAASADRARRQPRRRCQVDRTRRAPRRDRRAVRPGDGPPRRRPTPGSRRSASTASAPPSACGSPASRSVTSSPRSCSPSCTSAAIRRGSATSSPSRSAPSRARHHFETFFSLSCQNCPDVVQALT